MRIRRNSGLLPAISRARAAVASSRSAVISTFSLSVTPSLPGVEDTGKTLDQHSDRGPCRSHSPPEVSDSPRHVTDGTEIAANIAAIVGGDRSTRFGHQN